MDPAYRHGDQGLRAESDKVGIGSEMIVQKLLKLACYMYNKWRDAISGHPEMNLAPTFVTFWTGDTNV